MTIPHVDVQAQYAPLIPELKDAFARTLDSGQFIFGPEVEAFEREAAQKLGTADAVSCANGTDAIVLVLDAMGIGAGDEVICPSFTFYATAEAIARVGATPVFADIDPVTLNLDVAEVERRITDRTKALMPVHLFGRPAGDFSGFGLPVIEDSAQAFGAGGIATSIASTFSFFPTKNLFALGDGGLIGVNDAALAERLRMLRFHGSVSKKDFLYVGYNSRLDAMQAAFLRIFLRHIDERNARHREAAARYTDLLGGIVETPEAEDGHVYHMYCVRSPERDRLSAALKAADIGHAVYYLPPLHLQPALRYLGYSEGAFPETEKASRENLCLPLWAGITEAQQVEVVSVIKRASQIVRS
jgi:dTDP-4-amino-4,6-dideoxygalactose transaminase